MSEPKTIEESYEIIFDEIDQFMEGLYKENLLYERVIEQLQNDITLPEDVREIANSIRGADDVLSRLENMKMLLKSIAYQNHNLVFFTEEEQKDVFVRILLGEDPEVL
jgi:DNA helicase HerA-like ATPase